MKIKAAALLSVLLVAFAAPHSTTPVLLVAAVGFIFAFFADLGAVPGGSAQKKKKPRYQQVELCVGGRWGSKEDELRAHLVGAWEPTPVLTSHQTDPAETDQKIAHSRKLELMPWVACGLYSLAVVTSFWFWSVGVAVLFSAGIFSFWLLRSRKWSFGSPVFGVGVLALVLLSVFYSIEFLALSPALLPLVKED